MPWWNRKQQRPREIDPRMVDRLEYVTQRLDERINDLGDLIHLVMARTAALPPAVTLAKPDALPVAQKDEVEEHIELAAHGDRALHRHLQQWAKQQRLDGAKEHDIISSLLHWPSVNEWEDQPV